MTTGHMYLKLLNIVRKLRNEAKLAREQGVEAPSAKPSTLPGILMVKCFVLFSIWFFFGLVCFFGCCLKSKNIDFQITKWRECIPHITPLSLGGGGLQVDETHHPGTENFCLLKLLKYMREKFAFAMPKLVVSSATFGVEAFVKDFPIAKMLQIPVESHEVFFLLFGFYFVFFFVK